MLISKVVRFFLSVAQDLIIYYTNLVLHFREASHGSFEGFGEYFQIKVLIWFRLCHCPFLPLEARGAAASRGYKIKERKKLKKKSRNSRNLHNM